MGNISITAPLALTTDYASIDGRYTDANGNPYASVVAAETALGRRMNQYTVGLTVLVKESGWAEAKEYWVQPYDNNGVTAYHLVEKQPQIDTSGFATKTEVNAKQDALPSGTTGQLLKKTASGVEWSDMPSIEDGENTVVTLEGTIHVSAVDAQEGEGAGVEITPHTGGGIDMTFTLPKGNDAYEVYLEKYKEEHSGSTDGAMSKTEWLASLKGEKGDNAVNPFKGWYKTGDTLPTTGYAGDYLYFKDTSDTPAVTTIYRWNGTAFADTETEVDESNVQTFGSGQQVNSVKIKDENGDEDAGAEGVLSAEAGKELADSIKENTLVFEEQITDFTDTEGYIAQNSGLYAIHPTRPDSYHGALVSVNGYNLLKIVPHNIDTAVCTIAFLQNDDLVADQAPSYASGYTTTVNVISETEFNVPQDANYMWVYTQRGSSIANITPDIFVGEKIYNNLNTKISNVDSKIDDVDNRVDALVDNTSVLAELGYGAKTDGYISQGNGKYTIYETPNRYYGYLVDVAQLDRIKIVPHNSGSVVCTIAFLQNDTLVDGQTPNYATGYTTSVDIVNTTTVNVPQNANYMWVYTYRTKDITPELYKNVPINSLFPEKFTGVLVSSAMGIHSYANRFKATKQLFDIAIKVINSSDGYTPTSSETNLFDNGAVAILPTPSAAYGQKTIHVLYGKNENVQVPPASVTKVMSIISGLDYISSIKEQVSIVQSDIETGSGYTMYAGDVLTIEDILYSMMLVSSNTCAQAFGRIVGLKSLTMKGVVNPSVAECKQEFLDIMNAKAASIGMTNSVFITPSGQERTQQNLTTAADLLKMVVEACSYNELLRVWGKDSYTISFSGDHTRDVLLERTPFDDEFTDVYEYLGCKSGSLSYSEPTVWGTNTFVCVGKLL